MKAAPKKAAKPVKKNPLLEAEEDTSKEEETAEETQDESAEDSAEEAEEEAEDDSDSEDSDESEDEEEVEEAKPVKKAAAKPAAPAPKVNVDDELKSDIARTKAVLDAEEKVHFMIPLAEGEKAGAFHDCFINGYRVSVKKGVMTMVPRSIAELLANHYQVTADAGADFRLDLNEKKQDALS